MYILPASIRSRRYLRLVVAGFVLCALSAKLPFFFLGFFSSIDNTAVPEIKGSGWEEGLREKILLLEQKRFASAKRARGQHSYHADGLVEVNPKGPHPIFELINRAEKAWDEKLRKASSSLDEAIGEYRRRYRRNPPKGFDKWYVLHVHATCCTIIFYVILKPIRWNYVQSHDVGLPDEYDQIYHDLEPFWGLEPSYLLELQAERELKKDTYTIGKNASGQIDVLTTSFHEGRYEQLIGNAKMILTVLRDIEHLLPDFRATFSPHDSPNLVTGTLLFYSYVRFWF